MKKEGGEESSVLSRGGEGEDNVELTSTACPRDLAGGDGAAAASKRRPINLVWVTWASIAKYLTKCRTRLQLHHSKKPQNL